MFDMSNIKFYRSLNWGDNLTCGGTNTFSELADDSLTNLFTDVPGEYCMWGGHRYRKLFVGNESTTDTLRSTFIFVGKDSDGDDSLSLHIGTDSDVLYEIIDTYTTNWYGVGIVETELIGRDTRLEGPVTEYFNVTTLDSYSGFPVRCFVCIHEGDLYEIVETKDSVWESANSVRLYLANQLEHTFTVGLAEVSCMLPIGNFGPEQTVSIWIRQTIPVDSDTKRGCRPHIRIVGV